MPITMRESPRGAPVVVFVATPSIGTLVPVVEFARRLTDQDPRLSAAILVITEPHRPIVTSYIEHQSHATASSSTDPDVIRFIHLPTPDNSPSPDQYTSSIAYVSLYIQNHAPLVKRAMADLSSSTKVAALFVDLFTTPMADVAHEHGVPCYVFFASPASFLGFMFYFSDDADATKAIESEDMSTELSLPGFVNPVPKRVLPSAVLKGGDGAAWLSSHARKYKETRGIVVNTLWELEGHALESLGTRALPPVYPVGPLLDLDGPIKWHPRGADQEAVVQWLDLQPNESVVFLCFGSMGSLSAPQVEQIAAGLEQAGFRFLWSLREPPRAKLDLPGDYDNLNEALPKGFLDRTAAFGLVCGWVPQVTVLAHAAIGGFVSHCGWNSILESLWFGVPIATWPIYAEQQMNAFELVVELGLAVEIRVDYREGRDVVWAQELERALKCVMGGEAEITRKVKGMKDKCRMALMESGSSNKSLSRLVGELMAGLDLVG